MKSEHDIPEPRQFESVNVNVGETVIDMPEIFGPEFFGDLAEILEQSDNYSGGSWRNDDANPDRVETYVTRIRFTGGKASHGGTLRTV